MRITFTVPVGILGNLAVLINYTIFRKTSSSSNIFLFNLVLCDTAWILTLSSSLYVTLKTPHITNIQIFCQFKKVHCHACFLHDDSLCSDASPKRSKDGRSPPTRREAIITSAIFVFMISFIPYHIMVTTLVLMRIHNLVSPLPSTSFMPDVSFLKPCAVKAAAWIQCCIFWWVSNSRGSCWSGHKADTEGSAAEPAGGLR